MRKKRRTGKMWYRWVGWLMTAEDHWLDETGNVDYFVWESVNRYWCQKEKEWKI